VYMNMTSNKQIKDDIKHKGCIITNQVFTVAHYNNVGTIKESLF